METIIKTAWPIVILILWTPTINELIDNHNLETKNEKRNDVWVRVYCALAVSLVDPLRYLQNLVMCFALFFMTFDYLYNLTSKITKPVRSQWFSHLGTTSPIDRQFSKIPPVVRACIRVVVFLVATLYYTLP